MTSRNIYSIVALKIVRGVLKPKTLKLVALKPPGLLRNNMFFNITIKKLALMN